MDRWAVGSGRRRGAASLVCLALLGACTTAPQEPPIASAPEPASPAERPPAPDHDATPVPTPGATASDEPIPSPDGATASNEPDAPPEGRDRLAARLERLVATARRELDDAEVSVLIVDDRGRAVLDHDAEIPRLPASTMKLPTAAALLVTLGPEARLRTTLDTTAPIDGDGVVRGDLLLRGGGDPALASDGYGRWVYPARPRTPLETLADELVEMGLTRVDGDVVGAAEGFTGPLEAEGWRPTYFNDFDARYIAGLTVDAGLDVRLTWPEDEADEDDETESAEDDGDGDGDHGNDRRRPRSGRAEREVQPRVRLYLADDPTQQAAAELVRLLEERGVRIDGRARTGDTELPVVGRLGALESPPMEELLRFMVQRSDNHLADTLFLVAGRARTGEGSWERGERALLQVLDHLGVDRTGARFADGSGLSRDDRLSARTLVELDLAMSAGRHADTWRSLMAVAGESGTLRTRLRGSPVEGRLFAKTGSLRDVSALAGAVGGDEGERHHFAVVANDAAGIDRAVVRALVDDLAVLLAADLLDCRVAPQAGADEGVLGRAPLAAAC